MAACRAAGHRLAALSLLVATSLGQTADENCAKGASMFQMRSAVFGTKPEVCTPLKNQGTFFSAEVCVGTPPQCFDAVADTGSDNIIVPSCICDEVQSTGCGRHDRCFRGTNRSSTFSIPSDPTIAQLTFGSGPIEVAVASDIVNVSGVSATMTNGLLLILSRAALEVSGEFQGILGLGLPQDPAAAYADPSTVMAKTKEPKSLGIMDAVICLIFPQLCAATAPKPQVQPLETRLFLEMAHIDRFSMCFQDGERPGALRFNIPALSRPIPQVGKLHWGISFHGLSTGPRNGPSDAGVLFCGPETMSTGMTSPCGIIPDSGTTLITGPSQQIKLLQAELCSKWPRCREQARGRPSAFHFGMVLQNCSQWLHESGLAEIPSIFFHIKVAEERTELFELTSWAWVTQTVVDNKSVCMPGFGEMEYTTAEHGPVWILGTPLFYEYNVGYDLQNRQVSLERGHVWTKGDAMGNYTGPFITYFEDEVTETPARWVFFDGMSFDILSWEPGKKATPAEWQLPASCFSSVAAESPAQSSEVDYFHGASRLQSSRSATPLVV
ncbi:REN [Symbiodinium sp. CCMP2456]|nr:REN [Symbiodinium sp. CCMP2456]